MTDVVVIKREELDAIIRDTAEMASKKTAEILRKQLGTMRPRHVNQTQAAEMLNLSPSTICRMVKAGNIRLNKCGLIPIEQLEECVA